MAKNATNPDGSSRNRIDQLARQVYASLDGSKLFSPPTVMRTETALSAELISETAPTLDPQWTSTNTASQTESPTEGRALGLLNPDWVEWLMGWPIGWTNLKPLETDKFQQWLDSHGISLNKNEIQPE
jgi:hypothetical protein